MDEVKSAVANAKADLDEATCERRRMEKELPQLVVRQRDLDAQHRKSVRKLRAVKGASPTWTNFGYRQIG